MAHYGGDGDTVGLSNAELRALMSIVRSSATDTIMSWLGIPRVSTAEVSAGLQSLAQFGLVVADGTIRIPSPRIMSVVEALSTPSMVASVALHGARALSFAVTSGGVVAIYAAAVDGEEGSEHWHVGLARGVDTPADLIESLASRMGMRQDALILSMNADSNSREAVFRFHTDPSGVLRCGRGALQPVVSTPVSQLVKVKTFGELQNEWDMFVLGTRTFANEALRVQGVVDGAA